MKRYEVRMKVTLNEAVMVNAHYDYEAEVLAEEKMDGIYDNIRDIEVVEVIEVIRETIGA
jgi:hypothetical protein